MRAETPSAPAVGFVDAAQGISDVRRVVAATDVRRGIDGIHGALALAPLDAPVFGLFESVHVLVDGVVEIFSDAPVHLYRRRR